MRYAVSDTIPFYDQLYRIITAEIAVYGHGEPAVVSWLRGSKRQEAIDDLRNHPKPDISSINDPFGMVEPSYPKANFNFFSRQFSAAESSKAGTRREK